MNEFTACYPKHVETCLNTFSVPAAEHLHSPALPKDIGTMCVAMSFGSVRVEISVTSPSLYKYLPIKRYRIICSSSRPSRSRLVECGGGIMKSPAPGTAQ